MIFKRLTVAVAALFVLAGQAFGAGTIPFSLSQQLDQFGKPLAGCLFYTIQAGTTNTPQNAYQDSALTIALPNPQVCDASGRLPQMFLADGTIKVRLTDKNGVTVVVADNIQVIGASSGSGGGGTVDPTTILQTGWIQPIYGTGSITGFVRLNGRTIGSSTSGATERANADTQALFEYLWGADASLAVSGGRGATANADWTANKTLTLPDGRNSALAGLAGMGNSDTGAFANNQFSIGGPDVLGSKLGAASKTILRANLPSLVPSGTITLSAKGTADGGSFGTSSGSPFATWWNSATGSPAPTATFTGVDMGGTSQVFENVSPLLLVTIYIKL